MVRSSVPRICALAACRQSWAIVPALGGPVRLAVLPRSASRNVIAISSRLGLMAAWPLVVILCWTTLIGVNLRGVQ